MKITLQTTIMICSMIMILIIRWHYHFIQYEINIKSIKISQKIQNLTLGLFIHFFNKTKITQKLVNPHETDHHTTLEMKITSINRNNSILKSTKEPLERYRSTR